MKKIVSKLATVKEFDTLTAARTDGYFTSVLFCVEGRPGIWRRVPRSGQSLRKMKVGAVLGLYGSQVIELVRDTVIEADLIEAGFSLPVVTQDDALIEDAKQHIENPLEAELPLLAAIEREKARAKEQANTGPANNSIDGPVNNNDTTAGISGTANKEPADGDANGNQEGAGGRAEAVEPAGQEAADQGVGKPGATGLADPDGQESGHNVNQLAEQGDAGGADAAGEQSTGGPAAGGDAEPEPDPPARSRGRKAQGGNRGPR